MPDTRVRENCFLKKKEREHLNAMRGKHAVVMITGRNTEFSHFLDVSGTNPRIPSSLSKREAWGGVGRGGIFYNLHPMSPICRPIFCFQILSI